MLLLLAQVTLRAASGQDSYCFNSLFSHPYAFLLLFSATQQKSKQIIFSRKYLQAELEYEEAYTGLISKEQVFNNFGRCICFVSAHFY